MELLLISQNTLAMYEEEFSVYASESGISRELRHESELDHMEYEFIKEQLGMDWVVSDVEDATTILVERVEFLGSYRYNFTLEGTPVTIATIVESYGNYRFKTEMPIQFKTLKMIYEYLHYDTEIQTDHEHADYHLNGNGSIVIDTFHNLYRTSTGRLAGSISVSNSGMDSILLTLFFNLCERFS